MSDRFERAMVLLERPISGVDHLKAIDPTQLCDLIIESRSTLVNLADVAPLDVFSSGLGTRWYSASEGLKVTRDLIAFYEKWAAEGSDGATRYTAEHFNRQLATLRKLENLLDQADTRDIRFCFKGRR